MSFFDVFDIVTVDRWCAFTDYFDFDTDIYPSCLADAVCREKWNKEFFHRLKAFVLVRFDQLLSIAVHHCCKRNVNLVDTGV